MVARVSNLSALPDGGRRLKATIQQLRAALEQKRTVPVSAPARPASRPAPVPAPARPTGGTAPGRGSGGTGSGMSEVERVQAQIRQKRVRIVLKLRWCDLDAGRIGPWCGPVTNYLDMVRSNCRWSH